MEALERLVKELRESAQHHAHDYEGNEYHLGLAQGLREAADHVERLAINTRKAGGG